MEIVITLEKNYCMKQFNEFAIKPTERSFTGDRIKMKKILGQKIVICDYKTKTSNYPETGNGLCLYLQIEFENKKRVTWTNSVNMQEMIFKVDKKDLPIEATIVEVDERYEIQ